jgi:hypothetical protein
MKFRFIEVGPVEAEKPPHSVTAWEIVGPPPF